MQRIPLTDVSRDEWLALRLGNINASEVPIVLGRSTWGSLAELYAEKKGLRPPREDNSTLRKGRWGEAAVFEALADERPDWEINRAKVYVLDEERRQGCTPDGFAIAPDRRGIGVVQAKVIAASMFRQRWLIDMDDTIQHGEATVPESYRLQTLQEMRLNDAEWGVVAVVINSEFGWQFRLFDIERDPIIESMIDATCDEFFRQYLDAGIMPPFEPQRDEELIKALYPNANGAVVDLSLDNRVLALVEDLTETQAGLKRLEIKEKEIKAELIGKLQDNSFGQLADGRWLSWKQQNRRAYTVEAKSFRVLRVLSETPKELRNE